MKQKLPVGEAIGTVGSLVTILSFIGITPEMIGETAYKAWFYTSPFLCLLFGVLIGWSAHKRYSDKKKESEEPKEVRLTEEQMIEYLRKFPDRQKDTLYEIYEAGGSVEADALDSNLMALASEGLIKVPPAMIPGTNCAWSLTPEINDLITRHPEVVESKQAKQLKEREEKKNELTDYIKHLDHNSKVVLWAVYTSDDGFNFKDYDSEYDNDYILEANTELIKFKNLDLIDYEYIDTNKRKWSMTDLGKELVEENLGTFKYVKDALKEER